MSFPVRSCTFFQVGCVYEKGGQNFQEFGPVILASGGGNCCCFPLTLLWMVWWLWMGLPEILSSPALVGLVFVSLLWTVSRLWVSSFLLLVLLLCPLLRWCRALLHLRSFLMFPPLVSFGDLLFWLAHWLIFCVGFYLGRFLFLVFVGYDGICEFWCF